MRSTGFEPGSTKVDADSLRTELIRTGKAGVETIAVNLAYGANESVFTIIKLSLPSHDSLCTTKFVLEFVSYGYIDNRNWVNLYNLYGPLDGAGVSDRSVIK